MRARSRNRTADDADSIRELFERKGHRLGEYFETRGAPSMRNGWSGASWAGAGRYRPSQ